MKQIIKFFKQINRIFMKQSIWTRTAIVTGIILIILMIVNKSAVYKEGFIQREKYVLKQGDDIYDNFYSSIYDELVHDTVKNDFEIGEITRLIKPTAQSRVLDIGSGNGHHVKLLEKAGYNVEGIDKSSAMVEGAKNKYPKCKFKQADALESMTYPQNTFTTITCLYFTIYYISDKQLFLQNCYNWLKPGGSLVLHLVNRDKFDPILNAADPLHLVSAQKYAKKRITNSLVKFKDFQYKANFELDKSNNLAEFDETFKDDKSGHVRQNKHKLFIETQKHILSIAKNLGFILQGKVDMITSQYQYQYIYLLYKPQ